MDVYFEEGQVLGVILPVPSKFYGGLVDIRCNHTGPHAQMVIQIGTSRPNEGKRHIPDQ